MKQTIYGHNAIVFNEHLYILYAISAQLMFTVCKKKQLSSIISNELLQTILKTGGVQVEKWQFSI